MKKRAGGGNAMLRIVIKGPKKTAQRAAARRGIGVRNCVKHARFDETTCHAPCVNETKVGHWYGETGKRSRVSYEDGTVLYYSTTGCYKYLSPGAKPRKRKITGI